MCHYIFFYIVVFVKKSCPLIFVIFGPSSPPVCDLTIYITGAHLFLLSVIVTVVARVRQSDVAVKL